MKRSSVENWSAFKAVAFLAAVFAMVIGISLPTAVAASMPSGSAVMLCSGEQVIMVYNDDGSVELQTTQEDQGPICPFCVLTAHAGLPASPLLEPFAPPTLSSVRRCRVHDAPAPSINRSDWRPPSTAPPFA